MIKVDRYYEGPKQRLCFVILGWSVEVLMLNRWVEATANPPGSHHLNSTQRRGKREHSTI